MKHGAIATLVISFTAWGCSHSGPAPVTVETYPPTPAMTPASAATPPAPAAGTDLGAQAPSDLATQSQISISDPIRKACGISEADSYVAFDSTHLTPQAARVAKQLAGCFSHGPLVGKTMRLIGHADPRSSDQDAMLLGQRRADSLKEFFVQGGLGAAQIQASSRGKLDAKGYDEDTWALDRLVEIASTD